MIDLRADVRVELTQRVPALALPFKRILDEWARIGFDPRGCARALEAAIARRECDPRDFSIEAVRSGGVAATERVLFPPEGAWTTSVSDYSFGAGARRFRQWSLTDRDVRALAGELGAGNATTGAATTGAATTSAATTAATTSAATTSAAIQRHTVESEVGRAIRSLFAALPAPRPRLTWPRACAPGVFRREHASLAIRSARTTLVVDPIGASGPVNAGMGAVPKAPPGEHVDVVLITHGHSDHWHLPSVLQTLGADGIAIVPRVPKRSLLSPFDFSEQLTAAGIRHIAPAWGEVVRVGDVEIEILPFTGEQPTRDRPWTDPAIRNWGNCYRIDSADVSVALLADAGADPSGDVRSVLAGSRARRGPVDVVAASLRQFSCPFFGGLAEYWAPLPIEVLQALFLELTAGRLPSITAGPRGIAEACAAAGARYFLPYAHGFDGLGRAIADVGWGLGEVPERWLMERLGWELGAIGATTVPVDCAPGDVILFQSGAPRQVRLGELLGGA